MEGAEVDGIDRQRLDPDEARTHFFSARVDARDVDFSDRIDSGRKSYRASTRRATQRSTKEEELGDFSDEDETGSESLRRKIARLHRETEEIRTEIARRQASTGSEVNENDEDNLEKNTLTLLSTALEGLETASVKRPRNAEGRLMQRLSNVSGSAPLVNKSDKADIEQQSEDRPTYTFTYAPTFQQNHTLAKVADFDTRLTLLETVLGIDSIPIPAQDKPYAKAILPTLGNLDAQISTLSLTSPSFVDTVGRRVRELTQEAEKLDEVRKSAKALQEALRASQAESTSPMPAESEVKDAGSSEDIEQTSKINALFGTLATIESLAPLLPSVLDRLRSLRLIHADAASASQSLAEIERKQAEITDDIKSWIEGLEKVEEAMKKGETRMTENSKVVEAWVKDLEERISKLDS